MTDGRTGQDTQGDDEYMFHDVLNGGMRMNQRRHEGGLEAIIARPKNWESAFLAMPQQAAVASARSALGSRVYTDPIRIASSKETCILVLALRRAR